MKIVLRAALSAYRVQPAGDAELTRRRSITLSPKRGAPTALRERDPVRTPEAASSEAAVVS